MKMVDFFILIIFTFRMEDIDIFTVYILYSPKHNKIYVGFTNNLIQRFLSHNKLGKKGYTIKYRPWFVIYTEIFNDKTDAMHREKYWKNSSSRKKIDGFIMQYEKYPGYCFQ
jgi:putative endonuclease